MNNINANKVGLTFGALIGGGHLVWSVLIAIGWAQPLLNFIFTLHMIKSFIVVSSFDIMLAGTLVIITAIIGYVVGYIFSLLWNWFHQ